LYMETIADHRRFSALLDIIKNKNKHYYNSVLFLIL
jgi:hypothetical protein